MNSQIHPYRLAIPQADIDDLRERLTRTRWTDELPGAGQDYGIALDDLKALAEYWRDGYDWRTQEAAINTHPQFTTQIDGANIHFLHIRSPEPDATPLILTHGWPGSFLEFLDVIGPLSDPASHGADPADAFHLVIPSIPGFGPSGPTTERGWNVERVATAWAELMRRLGYQNYGAQGGDWGAGISRQLAVAAPEAVIAVHVNYLPHGPVATDELSTENTARVGRIKDFLANVPGYMRMHATRPQTIAYGLADSPVGQLAWIADKVKDWTDPAKPIPADKLLTNVSLHWFFGTAGSSARLTFESSGPLGSRGTPCPAPLAMAVFAHDIVLPVRSVSEELHPTLIRWTEFDQGGHFAAMEVPDLLVGDIREFFAGLRR